ncbi:Hint domain-containing protein [Acidocella sp.]|uniref:Hint domain-containing protein n=1 Tax=Acidocella sp. TaxID=50710 RepID=UPI003D05A008
MATTYGPSDSGVYYVVTAGTLTSSVSIQSPLGTQIDSIASVSNANIITTDGSELSIGALNSSTYVIVPGISVDIAFVASVASAPTIYIGGEATITSVASALSAPTYDVYGGSLTLSSGLAAGLLGSSTVNIGDGGTFTNGSGLISVLNGTTINFTTGGGTFIANAGGSVLDLSDLTINGFTSATSKIEFEDLSSDVESYKITTSGSSQTITLYSDTSQTTEIGSVTVAGTTLTAGTYVAGETGPLTVTQDSSGSGVNVTLDVESAIVPCFWAGTLIATPEGGKPVDRLCIGDLILTSDGHALPVRWVGRRSVSPRFADPLRVLPVRIRAGALGEGLPMRDLLLSPDHALLVGDVLANAGALVNGTTISRESGITENFVYYHVEVDEHQLILAEGVSAETFIDHVERMAFDNWLEHAAIFGDMPTKPEMVYPRVKSARQLPRALRAKLENGSLAAA